MHDMQRTINLLVVDDEPVMAKLIKRALEGKGFAVRDAVNGVEALAVMKEYTPDIVLTDVHMPYMGGVELAKNIRKMGRKIAICLASGSDEEKMKAHAIEAGAIAYIAKPYRLSKLADTLRDAVGKTAAHQENQVYAPDNHLPEKVLMNCPNI